MTKPKNYPNNSRTPLVWWFIPSFTSSRGQRNGGSFFSLSPKSAKHSVHANLIKKNNSETEINFNLSFLVDNIGLVIEYVIMILIIWFTIPIPIVGIFFLFAFIVTAAIHLPWWLYNRGKIRKEFSSQVNRFRTQIRVYLQDTDIDHYYGLNQERDQT